MNDESKTEVEPQTYSIQVGPPSHSPTMTVMAKALAQAQGEMLGAKKDAANPFYKSKYSDLASIIGAIREPLSKHGIAHVQIPGSDEDGIFVDTFLFHESGEWIKGRIRMTPVKDDPQGIGSVLSYMRRYALQAMVGLEAIDDDGNGASDLDGGKRPAQSLQPLPEGSFKQAKLAGKTPFAKDRVGNTGIGPSLSMLEAKAKALKIDPPILLRVANKLGDTARDFFDISEKNAKHMLDNWQSTSDAVDYELDNLPMN